MSKIANTLTWPFLPPDVKLQLRHRRLDAGADKRAGWALQIPDVAVKLVKAVDDADRAGRDPGMRLVPVPAQREVPVSLSQRAVRRVVQPWRDRVGTISASRSPEPRVLLCGRPTSMVCDGGSTPSRCSRLAVGRPARATACLGWLPSRPWVWPATGFSGSCSSMPRHGISAGCRRPTSMRTTSSSSRGPSASPYRSYAFTLAHVSSARVSPHALFEALFTQSARRVTFVSDEVNTGNDWFSDRKS